MVNYANVSIWGTQVGSLFLDENTGVISFEYTPEFVRSGLELSPIFAPLRAGRVYSFAELPYQTFKGLPGFLADSLPDKFGDDLINQWLTREGRAIGSYNAVERLLYQGSRAMGALTFEPAMRTELNQSVQIELEGLIEAALSVLNNREMLNTNLNDGEDALKTILRVGTSAGGSRAKAVVAYNKDTGEIKSGQVDAPEGFEHYLLKLDGVTNGSLGDPMFYGCIEYSYYRMALDCGIQMTDSFLLNDGKRRHFMTKRFDREGGSKRLHMVTLCGMNHMDFNVPGAYSYEQLFAVMRLLHLSRSEAEQAFRRMVFNIIGRNQDDHTKNFSFLMDTDGQWRLSPAYDMVYNYNRNGSYTNLHQMSVNGKRDAFSRADLLSIAENIHLNNANSIIDGTIEVFSKMKHYMEADIPEEKIDNMYANLRLNL